LLSVLLSVVILSVSEGSRCQKIRHSCANRNPEQRLFVNDLKKWIPDYCLWDDDREKAPSLRAQRGNRSVKEAVIPAKAGIHNSGIL